MFLASTGARHCPTCGRPWEADESPLLLSVIADYLLQKERTAGEKSTRTRLGHVVRYVNETNPAVIVAAVNDDFAEGFRKWMAARDASGGQKGAGKRKYSLSTIEGCLLQLAAAINSAPGQKSQFKFEQPADVAESPSYRADVQTIARMFEYCLRPDDKSVRHWREPHQINAKLLQLRVAERANLLRYLRMAVATWARPDAIYQVKQDQWHSAARVLDLNPRGRRQTRKYRPTVPIAMQLAPHLDTMGESWLPVSSIRAAWDKMAIALELPSGGQAGEKLIRRSMSTLVRRRIGEERWRQGEMMLGHVKASISDIYAIPDPANLGLVLSATEDIIREIEELVPGAF